MDLFGAARGIRPPRQSIKTSSFSGARHERFKSCTPRRAPARSWLRLETKRGYVELKLFTQDQRGCVPV